VNKYHAKKTVVDGITFDSKKEARRYEAIRRDPSISKLELQPKYDLLAHDLQTGQPVKVGYYKADFRYLQNGETVVEDVKGVKTPIYRLKKKMVEATHGIEIKET
jgi:hypothetical protein